MKVSRNKQSHLIEKLQNVITWIIWREKNHSCSLWYLMARDLRQKVNWKIYFSSGLKVHILGSRSKHLWYCICIEIVCLCVYKSKLVCMSAFLSVSLFVFSCVCLSTCLSVVCCLFPCYTEPLVIEAGSLTYNVTVNNTVVMAWPKPSDYFIDGVVKTEFYICVRLFLRNITDTPFCSFTRKIEVCE